MREPVSACGQEPTATGSDTHAGRARLLASAAFFEGMSGRLVAHVANHSIERRLDDGEALFFKNDPGDFMAIVVSGRIHKTLYGPEGQELIIDAIGVGESVGETALLDPMRRNFTAVAHGLTRVLVLPRRHFHLLLQEPALLERAYAVLCARLRRAVDCLETLCLHRLESRLARHLLLNIDEARSATSGHCIVTLPATQSILAAMVNASRPKLNAQLQDWDRSGLISRRHNVLRIHDMERIRFKAQLGRLQPAPRARLGPG
ncbi:Crp/Fnr family transcriptional regulator [Marilutibacter aestuarii]|nr:Crp/Fnr family transcriptional regulator [Lysobacter aestuarii]